MKFLYYIELIISRFFLLRKDCAGVSAVKKRHSRPKRWLFGLFVGLFFNALFGRRSNSKFFVYQNSLIMNNCFKEYFYLTTCITHSGDNTPPSLTCPPNIQTIAVQLQTWAVVSWAEPTANDGRDGGITYEISEYLHLSPFFDCI